MSKDDPIIRSAEHDLLKVNSPIEEVFRIAPDGRLFWRGREVLTDDDLRETCKNLCSYLYSICFEGAHVTQPVSDDQQAKDAPLEATAEMVDAAHAIVSQSGGYRRELVWPMYRAMIAALSATKQEEA